MMILDSGLLFWPTL